MPASLPLLFFLISLLGYCFGRLALGLISSNVKIQSTIKSTSFDAAERGDLFQEEKLEDDEIFELEKRAFLTKTWLFVCHRSRFSRPGDYHTFTISGIPFFIVLGKDMKLRAFHNVCRHRAYTVVRKSCGTSTRFSCKYHGWQYDDHGNLVKAPKFDKSHGFKPEDNGLYEVKLLRTQEGLLRVNFAESAMDLPFDDMISSLGMGDSAWVDGFDKETDINWKILAQEFANQAQWSQSTMSWLPLRTPKNVQLLGPLAMLREMSEHTWCTMTLLPDSSSRTIVRSDFYSRAGHAVPSDMISKYKLTVEREILALQIQQTEYNRAPGSDFTYECGGRSINLAAILSHHSRIERLSGRKMQPTVRLGQGAQDQEATALCHALDRPDCPKLGDLARDLEW